MYLFVASPGNPCAGEEFGQTANRVTPSASPDREEAALGNLCLDENQ